LEVDVELMNDDVLKVLKELEADKMRMINEQFLERKTKNKNKKNKYEFKKYKITLEKYNKKYNNLVDFITTKEYDERLEIEQRKIDVYNKKNKTKLKVQSTD
jgi:hypothetical protein